MPRTFIGWTVPADVREEIGRIAQALRTELPRASWTRSDHYHITFAFLGDQDEESIDRLSEALVTTIRELPGTQVTIGDAGFFPSERRPRVGWLGLRDHDRLMRIAENVRHLLKSEKIAFDEKLFHPHLTLVRLRTPWRRTDVDRFASAWQPMRGRLLLVDSVTLFESPLGSGGARHLPRTVARCQAADPVDRM